MKLDISKNLTLTPKNSALLVVDMQVDFYSPTGKAAKRGRPVSEMQKITKNLNDFAHKLSQAGVFVVMTKFIAGSGITPENLRKAVEKEGYDFPCIKGLGGEEFYDIKPPKNAIILEKPHYDAFAYTNLHNILKEKGIHNVLVSGVRTEICVDITSKRAASEGFDTFVVSDLVATYDDKKDAHNEVLQSFKKYYGYVLTSREIIHLLNIILPN